MKIWLDDVRPPPDNSWEWVQHPYSFPDGFMDKLRTGKLHIEEISFDHDMGFSTSIRLAEYIEEGAYKGTIPPIKWHIHSMNPVGAANLRRILERADRFWTERENSAGHL